MTDKELKKLNRTELLEILIAQMEENEVLRGKLDVATKQLEDRKIIIDKAGSIAEASLQLNGVFRAAEEAANQYLENIQEMSRETKVNCKRMEEEAQKKADEVVAKAEEQSLLMKQEADTYCANVNEKLQRLYKEFEGFSELFKYSVVPGVDNNEKPKEESCQGDS